jgi:hypothetical protein
VLSVRPRRSAPATPLRNGLAAGAIAFFLPVIAGLVTGNMTLRDFGFVLLLSVAAVLVVFAVTAAARRRHT